LLRLARPVVSRKQNLVKPAGISRGKIKPAKNVHLNALITQKFEHIN